jgi:hypothetical protein
MTREGYESGNDMQGRDASGSPVSSGRGPGADPDALHDPVRADRTRSAEGFAVSGAGGSDHVGELRRPAAGQPGHDPGVDAGRDARGLDTEHGGGRDTSAGTGATGGSAGPGGGAQLLPHGERDKLGLRLQQAVNQFVDEPRRAVEEADHVLEEATRHVAETLAEHRRSLRGTWESKDRESETEELRVALRKYREVTERLLQM